MITLGLGIVIQNQSNRILDQYTQIVYIIVSFLNLFVSHQNKNSSGFKFGKLIRQISYSIIAILFIGKATIKKI